MNYDVKFKRGEKAWCIRLYHSRKTASQGIISEIFFDRDMDIVYVVKGIGRGRFGEKVFKTKEEADRKIFESFGEPL